MTTVITGVDRVGMPELTETGVAAVNDILEEAMAQAWPETTWRVIPGGRAHAMWNVLVVGNNYSLPTPEQEQYAEYMLENVMQDEQLPPGSWVDETSEEEA